MKPACQLTSKLGMSRKPHGQIGKGTFYLSREAVNDIEDIWMGLRSADRRLGISKSDIVSRVVEKTLWDLKKEPEDKLVRFFKG